MNAWGITLLWTAAQVCVLLAAGTVVYLAVRRRNPAAGAWAIAAVLLAAISLSGFALTPWPQWWSADEVWSLNEGGEAQVPTNAIDSASGEPSSAQVGVTGSVAHKATEPASEADLAAAWREFLTRFQDNLKKAEQADAWRMPAWLAVATFLCIAIGLLRFAIGLLSVWRFAARAQLVADSELLDMLQELRGQLSYKRAIQLRVASHLGSPCTLGWTRPVVILPADWTTWTASELRSVLAHEVAHVVRGDFAAGLFAQLAVVLHFYNPLIWWLLGRLRLEQEMAADLCGARLAGGQQAYLTALARMALRQHDLPLLARPFFQTRGTVLRRVEMLHKQAGLRESSISWSGRIAVAMLLLCTGGLLAGVRGPGESIANAAPPEKPTEPVASSESDEISAIVKASDPRLEMEQLNSQYKKLDEFIRNNPDRVTNEIKLAHRHLAERLRSAAMDFTHYQELLLAGKLTETAQGAKKIEPESEGVEVRHARAALGVALNSLKHLEAASRASSEAVTPVELSRSRRNVWLARLSLVDAESDAAVPSNSKDLSPEKRRARAREAFLRQQSADKLKLIGIGLQAYHNAYKHFPPAVVIGPDGKTAHSWRVALLPFFEGEARKLYDRYRLNEPWDSEHNKALIPEGAAFYSVPSEALSENCGYYVLTGPGTAFDPEKNTTMRMIVDGMAWTMGVIEAKRDIPWTRLEDIPYAPEAPLAAFGGFYDSGFNAVFMDGAAHFLPTDMDEQTLRALITKAGRESMRVDRSTGRLTVSPPRKARD